MWSRCDAGCSASYAMTPARIAAAAPTATPTVRQSRRRPANKTNSRPSAGTSERMPPTSAPNQGAASKPIATTARASAGHQASRGRAERSTTHATTITAEAASTAYDALPMPTKRAATVGV